VALRFGVNDMGSIMIEENVISAAGARNRANDAELRKVIEDAGFVARQRTTLYERYVN
jgi:cyclic dehypoxanthinyl futalosine synthase